MCVLNKERSACRSLVCRFLPCNPVALHDGLDVVLPCVMRIENQQLHFSRLVIEINAEQGIGQDAASDGDRRSFCLKVVQQFSGDRGNILMGRFADNVV